MTETLIEAAIACAKTFFAGESSGHDFWHTWRVYRLATCLAEETGADVGVCQLAALLHDLDDVKLSPETAAHLDHARDFLRGHGCGEAETERILHIIRQISFKGTDSVRPDSLEGQVVQDADRLDAIGAIGIARTFAFGGHAGRPIYDPDTAPRLGMEVFMDDGRPDVYRDYSKICRVWAPQVLWDPDYIWKNGERGGYFVYYSLLNSEEDTYDRIFYSYADRSFTFITIISTNYYSRFHRIFFKELPLNFTVFCNFIWYIISSTIYRIVNAIQNSFTKFLNSRNLIIRLHFFRN